MIVLRVSPQQDVAHVPGHSQPLFGDVAGTGLVTAITCDVAETDQRDRDALQVIELAEQLQALRGQIGCLLVVPLLAEELRL